MSDYMTDLEADLLITRVELAMAKKEIKRLEGLLNGKEADKPTDQGEESPG